MNQRPGGGRAELLPSEASKEPNAHRVRTGADALVEGIAAAGVSHVFGLPGDTGVDLYDSLSRLAHSICHVMCRDERHAAMMADVYARCTGTVGVVEVSSGGGATFCIGGLGEAFAASIPVLVISSDIHAGSRDTGALTELDQEKLFSAVTKWVRRVESADDIPAVLVEAIRTATTGRPAPVAVIVPENTLAEQTDAPAQFVSTRLPAERTVADAALVSAVARALVAAERPAIVAGGGVHSSGAYAELAALAESAAVPVATTVHGKGTYPETAPWSLGVSGANGARPYANEYLASADFVLLVGTRANATDTNSYRSPPRSAAVAQIDIDAQRAGRNYPGSIGLVGDAAATLVALASEAVAPADRRMELRHRLEELRTDWRRTRPDPAPEGMVHPLAVLETIRDIFGSGAVIVADCGTATPFLGAHWETEAPGRLLVLPRGHGPMGYAIPGSVGASFANPGRRIVAVTTDGSIAMACGELETVARLRLPITFVQLTNGSYGWIKMLQHLYHDRRYFGVDLGRIEAPALSESFGIPAAQVRSIDALRHALEASADPRSGPQFFEVLVPDETAISCPVAPWTAALSGRDGSRPVY